MIDRKIDNIWKKLFLFGLAIGVIPPVIYTVLVFFIQQSGNFDMNIDPTTLELLFYVLIAISLLGVLPAILIIKKIFMTKASKGVVLSFGSGDREKTFENTITPFLFKTYILICALCETVGIFGLVLGILGLNFLHFIIFEALAIVYFFIYSFKKHEVREMAYSIAEIHGLIEVNEEL